MSLWQEECIIRYYDGIVLLSLLKYLCYQEVLIVSWIDKLWLK